MPLRFRPRLSLAAAVALTAAGAAWAAPLAPRGVDRLSETYANIDEGMSVITAQVIEGSPQTELTLIGEAEIRRAGTVIRGDEIKYRQPSGEVTARGNAVAARKGASISSDEINYQLDAGSGQTSDARYEIGDRDIHGTAGCVKLNPDGTTDFRNVFLTSCPEGQESWWVEMSHLRHDQDEELATGTGAVFKVAGLPVFGTPWFTFPATGKRTSGLLVPVMGWDSEDGIELSLPYYFNLAPNYDYTFTPHLWSKRGVLLGNEFRFLEPHLQGVLQGDYMPHDQQADRDRFYLRAILGGNWNGFSYGVNYNRVSDRDYPDDFDTENDHISTSTLPQNYWLSYSGSFWRATIRADEHQPLDVSDRGRPYERVPQISLIAYQPDIMGLELTTNLESSRFRHVLGSRWTGSRNSYYRFSNGERFVASQQVSWPLRAAGWFVVPTAELTGAWYSLDTPFGAADGDTSVSRVLPVLSLDSGLIFDRQTSLLDRSTTQTLEPRLFYAYIPHRDQKDIPIFDSNIMDSGFDEMFRANEYVGWDRYGETNQVSAALTTRLIDEESGLQWLSASVGQRFYLSDYGTGVDGDRIERDQRKGDLLAEVKTRLSRGLTASAFGHYSWDRHKMERGNAGVSWNPRPSSVINLSYRYNRASYNDLLSGLYDGTGYDYDTDKYVRQIDFSAQWPLTRRFYALTRHAYSLSDAEYLENLVGFEYQANCWALRFVFRHYINSDGDHVRHYMVQVELKGLGAVGVNPLSELERNIRGYQSSTYGLVPSSVGLYDYYQ